MLSVRYAAGKIWLNFACALAAGAAVVVMISLIWPGAARIGSIGGMVAVVAMLLSGVIKRTARLEPFLVIDGRGVTVDLLGIGLIPWDRIRATRIAGVPWVIGLRLILEYTGTAPKVGFMSKLSWGLQAKQVGDMARLTIGFLDLTDQSRKAVEDALSRVAARAA